MAIEYKFIEPGGADATTEAMMDGYEQSQFSGAADRPSVAIATVPALLVGEVLETEEQEQAALQENIDAEATYQLGLEELRRYLNRDKESK
jgi:hypothetical protein